VLRRGQRAWVILSHYWDGEEERPAASLPLRRGTYQLTAEFSQAPPEHAAGEDARPSHTGFQVKYRGPDSRGRRTEIPHRALFTVAKDATLRDGIEELSPGAAAYLDGLYGSSLRDIRRTYQRAFKALLLCERLELSARHQPHGTSELGYLLSQPGLFAGASYYSGASGYLRHAADLDFDFLPVRDGYHPPPVAADQRACPAVRRVQALFDWWERLTDYAATRADVRHRTGRHLWHLFEEARDKQPLPPDPLLRHLGAEARHWPLELRYFQDQGSAVYDVTSADLADERWALRAWHADRWLRAAQRRFAATGLEAARPDLWASDDPSATVPGAGLPGNASLVAYVTDGCLGHGGPRRYDDLRGLNDGLRERGRRALTAFLCQRDRVPLPWRPGGYAVSATDLSGLLLLDVEAGLREQASRIEDACGAAQALVSRIMLGLEPGWPVTREFRRLWQGRFLTFATWQRARRRDLYRENWIEWDEVARARQAEREALAASQAAAVKAERFAHRSRDVQGVEEEYDRVAEETEAVIHLAGLAGGTDGQRRVALTTYVLRHWFGQVVAAANVRLSAMSSGRYELRRTDEGRTRRDRSGLTLAVIDRHTGEERSPASLSGGETFYTSLALALGLADIVRAEAGGVDLDTLFIDEGFGSLDSGTLDQVMGVIDDLRDRGRVIGIVSHVAELKERVPERLEVRRLPADDQGASLQIDVEVANFYPAIASRLSTAVYKATQAFVHVLVTHAFLRSLATLELAESKVGRLRDETNGD